MGDVAGYTRLLAFDVAPSFDGLLNFVNLASDLGILLHVHDSTLMPDTTNFGPLL
jgi:hypothetical protein